MALFDLLLPDEILLGSADLQSEASRFPFPVPDALMKFWKRASGHVFNPIFFEGQVRHTKGDDEWLGLLGYLVLPSLMSPGHGPFRPFEEAESLATEVPMWKGKILGIPVSSYTPEFHVVCTDAKAGIVGDVYDLHLHYLNDTPFGWKRFGSLDDFFSACEIDWESHDETYGCDDDGIDEPELFRAIRRNDSKRVESLIGEWKQGCTYRGMAPLSYAIQFGWPEVLAEVGKSCRSITTLSYDDCNGGGPLHKAAGDSECVYKTLIELGCDVNSLDEIGNPSWLLENMNMVNLCLAIRAGARTETRNASGESVRDFLSKKLDDEQFRVRFPAHWEKVEFTYSFAKKQGVI